MLGVGSFTSEIDTQNMIKTAGELYPINLFKMMLKAAGAL